MRVMSYNLFGWNALVQNSWKAENVYKAIRQINPDREPLSMPTSHTSCQARKLTTSTLTSASVMVTSYLVLPRLLPRLLGSTGSLAPGSFSPGTSTVTTGGRTASQ